MLLGIGSFLYHVPHAEHMKSSIGRNGEARSSRNALRLFRSWNPFRSWRVASLVAKSLRCWRQSRLCHRYLVFRPFVEQLPSCLLCQLWCACLTCAIWRLRTIVVQSRDCANSQIAWNIYMYKETVSSFLLLLCLFPWLQDHQSVWEACEIEKHWRLCLPKFVWI